MVNQFFSNMDQYPEMKLLLTVGIILVVLIVAWLLLRNVRLWYWKTDKVLDSMRDMKMRMNQIESDLDLIKVNADILKQSETPILGAPEERREREQLENPGVSEEPECKVEGKGARLEVQNEEPKNRASAAACAENISEISEIAEDGGDGVQVRLQSQNRAKIGETKSREERIARKRALDARETMKISREELSALVTEWEEQQRKWMAAEWENTEEKSKMQSVQSEEQGRQNERKPKALKKKQTEMNVNANVNANAEANIKTNGLQPGEEAAAGDQNRIPAGGGTAAEHSMNEELEGVKKALGELQRQKEQLEADLKARIRI